MDVTGSHPFLPGRMGDDPHPLARFLPPIPGGVISAWLGENVPPGAWVLDPFGAAPELPVEAAQAGYRVLVTANNPVARFLLEMAANPTDPAQLRAGLADLAAARKGDQRIEPLVQDLYATPCASCGRQVIADAFLWERDAPAPFARIYRCPHCGDEGERPATESDVEKTARFARGGLHQAWALERVTPVSDPDRRHAAEALSIYQPRAQYALFTLITKLEGLPLPPERRRGLDALLISASDRANNLWPHPGGRPRPRQLTTPPQFIEHNVWKALNQAVDLWSRTGPATPLTYWPDPVPESGGVCLFQGRLKDVAPALGELGFAAVVTALPRPNQAYWTLSALWSAWLWGREALGPFKSVIRRRRYDWSWHATALHAANRRLAPAIPEGAPLLALSAEVEAGMLSAAVVAGELSGFPLTGLAFRTGTGQAQLLGRRAPARPPAPTHKSHSPLEIAQAGVRQFLQACGEPTDYLHVHAAALSALSAAGHFPLLGGSPGDILSETQDLIAAALADEGVFLRFAGSQHSLDVGQWWLVDPGQTAAPLADRLELALAAFLQEHPDCRLAELDFGLCRAFPGLLTAEGDLVQACLESYSKPVPEQADRWRLREQDQPETRVADQERMRALLYRLAGRLAFEPQGDDPVVWAEPDGRPAYTFYVRHSAVLGDLLLDESLDPSTSLLVLPGGRANLLLFKLSRDPRLQAAADRGWRFLKFRRLRRMAEGNSLTRQRLDEQFALDPLTYTRPQIPLL